MILGATAADFGGNAASAPTVSVTVIPDPLTTVVGRVIDGDGNTVVGAAVSLFELSTTTGSDGTFTLNGVPTVRGPIAVEASVVVGGRTLRGRSAPTPPVPAGTTDVGTIRVTEGNVLILSDIDGPSINSLAEALRAAGNTVTVRPAPEYTWDGTNPSLDEFSVVIHLNGATFGIPLPDSAQLALTQFVQNGGGFIGAQWNGFELAQGRQQLMRDLILQGWASPSSENHGGLTTFNVVAGQQSHPVLAGVPGTFTFSADWNDSAAATVFGTDPSVVLMQTPTGGPAVLVRQFGSGRVVNMSHAAGYTNAGTLQDVNIQRLYINAVLWATSR
jgi:hypothetical protein